MSFWEFSQRYEGWRISELGAWSRAALVAVAALQPHTRKRLKASDFIPDYLVGEKKELPSLEERRRITAEILKRWDNADGK